MPSHSDTCHPRRRRGVPRPARWVALLFTGAVVSSCLYDPDDRCGPNQRFDGVECVCEDGNGRVDNECVACDEHEVGNATGPCSCAEGYVRVADGAPCTEVSMGDDCTSDNDCPGQDFGHCHLEGDAGYCTASECTPGADECPGDYACNDRASPSFCERPPTGLGTPCTSSDDCAEFEASYCETVAEQACLVADCAADPSRCHGDWVCCDLAILSTSLCLPPSELDSSGACPYGGTLVTR
jgi:hypothetical protein